MNKKIKEILENIACRVIHILILFLTLCLLLTPFYLLYKGHIMLALLSLAVLISFILEHC